MLNMARFRECRLHPFGRGQKLAAALSLLLLAPLSSLAQAAAKNPVEPGKEKGTGNQGGADSQERR